MKAIIFLSLFLNSYLAIGQVEKRVDSKISEVTVFLDRAQILREVKTRVEAGKTNLIISGLTSFLDPQSVQVDAKGNFIILGIQHQQNFLSEINLPKSLRLIRDSIDLVTKQIAIEQIQKDVLIKEEQLLTANQKISGDNHNLTVAELKAISDYFRTRVSDIGLSRIKLDEKIKKLNDKLTRLNLQYNEQNELQRRNTSELVISLSAEASTTVDLNLSYVTHNAGWNALYDVRAANTKSPLQLSYKANVYQTTGEEWKQVKLILSTANPSISGVKPELNPWYLDFYNPIVMNRRTQKTYAPSMARMEMAEKVQDQPVMAAEASTVADFVSVTQTTLNTEFQISLPYTILSSPQPTVVDIRNHELKAAYQYTVAPKLDTDVFLMARATSWEEYNLLPGEANIFFEGTYVAKSFIDPNNTKDTLSFSLGRDKRIIVKRDKVKDLTSRNVIGTTKKETYNWEISLRNTKMESVVISIEDQIPVTQNTQIEVTLLDAGGAKHDKVTGKLKWEINLAASETRKVNFKYEVKYPKDKTIIGL